MAKIENDNSFRDFLWGIAGFKKEIIEKCELDSYHAKKIGWMMLFVGIYVTVAWTFFFQQANLNSFASVALGVIFGCFIVAFDGTIIASMSFGKVKWESLILRLGLALAVGLFLSQPIIQKIYESDILREAKIIAGEQQQEHQLQIERRYEKEINSLEEQRNNYQKQLQESRNIWVNADHEFSTEMDGTGGTGARGYRKISRKKEDIAKNYRKDFLSLKETLVKKITLLDERIFFLQDQSRNEVNEFIDANSEFSSLVKEEALQKLLENDKSGSLQFRYNLLSIILVLLELSAIILKIYFKMPSYKAKIVGIQSIESKDSMNKEVLTTEKLDQYKEDAKTSQIKLIKKFFADSEEINERKLEVLIKEWKSSSDTSFNDFWERFKSIFILNKGGK